MLLKGHLGMGFSLSTPLRSGHLESPGIRHLPLSSPTWHVPVRRFAGADDIADGNPMLTLGHVWSIIEHVRYQGYRRCPHPPLFDALQRLMRYKVVGSHGWFW